MSFHSKRGQKQVWQGTRQAATAVVLGRTSRMAVGRVTLSDAVFQRPLKNAWLGDGIVYVVCDEHIERAIDEFVEVYESPPDIYLLKDMHFTAWTAPSTCDFCGIGPVYLVV